MDNQKDIKKTWQTPKLRVLCRVRAEERVLAACKTKNVDGPGGMGECADAVPLCQGIQSS